MILKYSLFIENQQGGSFRMRFLSVVNLVLVGIVLIVLALFIFSKKEKEGLVLVAHSELTQLPKSLFAESDDFFQNIGESFLTLKWVPPQMQLPDLRSELIFYGKNARPDFLPGKSSFHVSLKSSGEKLLIREGERTYLVYQGNYFPKEKKQEAFYEHIGSSSQPIWGDVSLKGEQNDKNSYVFSPGNQPTPLWFEVKNSGELTIEVRIHMLDEKGALVVSPAELRVFQLQIQDFSKAQAGSWDLGGWRVDSTLLVRQKARWVGPDLFLKLHGGNEFAHIEGKERIDFFEHPNLCSCFVSVNDFLIWKDGRWSVAKDTDNTEHFPLLVVKKIEEKILSLELWDAEGRGKTLLSLIRAKDHNGLPDLSQEFKFVGAKTWAQFIVECRSGIRMTLKPNDWLVLTQNGWVKLDSPSQIDDFVNQSLIGPLFILDKMVKKNGRQVLMGHLFNTTRTSVEEIELTSSSPTPLANFYRHIPIIPPIQPKAVEIEGDEE